VSSQTEEVQVEIEGYLKGKEYNHHRNILREREEFQLLLSNIKLEQEHWECLLDNYNDIKVPIKELKDMEYDRKIPVPFYVHEKLALWFMITKPFVCKKFKTIGSTHLHSFLDYLQRPYFIDKVTFAGINTIYVRMNRKMVVQIILKNVERFKGKEEVNRIIQKLNQHEERLEELDRMHDVSAEPDDDSNLLE
jgi:hypothetical protein